MSAADDGTAPSQTEDEEQDDSPRFQWESLIRNSGLVLVLLVMLWLAFNVRLPSLDQLQQTIESWGWLAWAVFIGLYALVALTPIPVTIMAIAGGLLFGVVIGSVLSAVGVLIGCWGAYWLARGLGRQTTMRLLGSHQRTISRHLEDAGFQAVFMLRLLPGFPYWPVNYGSGAFGVDQRAYLIASAIAVIPGQVSLVAIGAFVADQDLFHGLVVAVAWAAVIVLTIWAYRQWRAARSASNSSRQPL